MAIVLEQVKEKYPNVVINELPDDEWNLLDEAMFNDDWDTIAVIMQPRQELATGWPLTQ